MSEELAEQLEIRVFDSPEGVAFAAAESFVGRASATPRGRQFRVALSGGSTPKRLFSLLANAPYRDEIAWDRVHLFWGDERTVPPNHTDSNFGAADAGLISQVPIPAENVHRIRAELSDPREAALQYETELRRAFGLADGEIPRFDLALLGMGADGHTASLFPGSETLEEEVRLAVAVWVEELKTHRITLTCPVLNNSACILFLVTGAEKAVTLREVLESEDDPPAYPAQLIQPVDGELLWYVDRAAAAELLPGGMSFAE